MAVRMLPNALGMSEFLGYTGDCTQTAELCCLHVLDPQRWPLTADTLNALVRADIAAGRAAASGAETLDACAADLRGQGVDVQQVGYQEPLQYDWHSLLARTAGYQPVLLQVAHGAAFGVESTLHYHAVAVLGHDPDAQLYYVADGDNPACADGTLVRYTLAQLYAAQPCGLLVPSLPTPPPPPPPDLAALRTQLDALLHQATALVEALRAVRGALG